MKSSITKALIGGVGASVVTLCLAASAWTMSPGEGHHKNPARIVDHMSEKLELTEEQATTVEELLTGSFSEARADKERLHALKKELHGQRGAFDEGSAQSAADEVGLIAGRLAYQLASTHAQIYQLLSEEQRLELDEMIENREGRRNKRRHFMRGGRG
ncbi:MAG: protein CpxP [Halioglobus sp.]|jgi:protein CpxP